MNNNVKQAEQKDNIELKELFNKIRQNKKTLIKSAIIAFILGVFFVIFTPKLYKTQVSLLAESNANSAAGGLMGQLGGLDMGSLIGLDMGGGESVALTPDLYPEVVKSTTFLVGILKEEVYLQKENINVTVSTYLQEHTKPSITGRVLSLLNLFKSEGVVVDVIQKKEEGKPLYLSQANSALIESLANTIELNIVESGGGLTGGESKIIKVSVEQQDPYVSALLTEKVIASLKQYIVDYLTSKAKRDLVFIEDRYKEAQAKYFETQKALADYDDSNINVILQSANTSRIRLATENSLASNLYNGLAQKLEQAKIIVQDKTPVFTVIEPAKVPLRKSKPKTMFTIISLTLIGLFLGICKIIWQEFVYPYKA